MTQFEFRTEALKWSSQLIKNNLPLHTVQQALCSERFFLWIFCDNTHGNAISELSRRFSTTKHFQHTVQQWIMYLSTLSVFWGVKIFLGIQKMWKTVGIPAQFWEVNLLNCICSRQILVAGTILQHQKLFTELPEGREGREGMNNRERLFFLFLGPQH